MINYICSTGFFQVPNINAVTNEPITIDIRYITGFVTTGNTNIPPCGAGNNTPNIIESPPAIAAPIIEAGITFTGSDAANGIAPSVINYNPII